MSSGLWPGYWSYNCEAWFQQRYQSIRDGAGPKSGADWKNAMKLMKQVSKLRDANSAASAAYLKSPAADVLF
jgi:hypothetical protein